MPIPVERILQDISDGKITRIGEVILYNNTTVDEWREFLRMRNGALERLMANAKKYGIRHVDIFSKALGIKVSKVETLINEQRKYEWRAMRQKK